jgi:hypothetical protein
MLFGLTNTPITFQSYIHETMRGLLDNFIIIYLDNILIFLKNEKEYVKYIKQVLAQL